MGVAPKANLLEGKVLNRYGWGTSSWIIAGIEWAVTKRADIISMSLGGWPTDGNDPLSLAVDWAFDQGALVVVAAGNLGSYFGVTTPGAARKALTVGAVDDSDNIAWFSSRGPTLDYRVKPEIVAPGVGICSSVPYYVFGVSYSCWSGTSMATPHVAGAAALVKQFARNYFGFDAPPEILKNWLLVEATDDLGYNIYEQGAGRLNIKKVITRTRSQGHIYWRS
jgi:subtilisin family serine protease